MNLDWPDIIRRCFDEDESSIPVMPDVKCKKRSLVPLQIKSV